MNELVDNGKILEVRRFPVKPNDNLPTVLSRTHSELLTYVLISSAVCIRMVKLLEGKVNSIRDRSLEGKARRLKELDALQKIDKNVSEKELKRIIRATYIEGDPPKVEPYYFTFRLELDDL